MDYSENLDKVQNYLKKRFRSEKLKATEKRLDSIMKSQEGEIVKRASSKLIDEEYFIFDNYFGKIIQKCDYVSIEKRDMEKPIRRASASTTMSSWCPRPGKSRKGVDRPHLMGSDNAHGGEAKIMRYQRSFNRI